MGDFEASFGNVVRGLVSLEINTIVKASMTAAQMPSPAEALEEVATVYRNWLQKHGAPGDLGAGSNPAGLQLLATAAEAVRVHTETTQAAALLAKRIKTNCGQLIAILPELLVEKPTPQRILQLRKTWEVGTEEIVMQTVVFLDGDVVQRVRPDVVRSDLLLPIHQMGVKTSIDAWNTLARLIRTLFEDLWKTLAR